MGTHRFCLTIELKYKEAYFTDLLGLKNGIPSHDTFSAVFSIIEAEEFMECFVQWIVDLSQTRGNHIAIDGKAVRAACEKVYKKKAPVLVNAFMVEAGICIGQIKIDEKTNEIKGIPDLMSWLNLESATVTLDAIGCQKDITNKIIKKGGDYVSPVKNNQRNMHNDILLEMEITIAGQKNESKLAKEYESKGIVIETPLGDKIDIFQDYDTGHARFERRTYYLLDDVSCIDKEEWSTANAIGMVKKRTVGDS